MRQEIHFKYLTLLATLYVSILQISVLLDYKYISVGSMLTPSATFVISITFFLSDIIAEVYGCHKAKQVVWSGIICLLLFSCIGYTFEKLPTPSAYYQYGHAYHLILNLLFRAGLSNAAAIMIGAFFNIYFVSKWKTLLKGKYFWLRSLGASAIGELIYTIFVVSLTNFGLVPFHHLIEIFIISYSFKLIFDTFSIIPAALLTSFLKNSEQVDVYDFQQNLNPFKQNINEATQLNG